MISYIEIRYKVSSKEIYLKTNFGYELEMLRSFIINFMHKWGFSYRENAKFNLHDKYTIKISCENSDDTYKCYDDIGCKLLRNGILNIVLDRLNSNYNSIKYGG